jgi:hypothetical protein
MKALTPKSSIIYWALFLGTATPGYNLSAQLQTSKFEILDRFSPDLAKAEKTVGSIPETAVSIKAIRSFRKTYPDISNAKWDFLDGYYFVSFSIDGVKHKIVYTKNGSLDYAMKMYEERDLPKAIRALVKSQYYDYTIHTAQELRINNKTIYIIQMCDSSSWKSVRVCEGEIEEIENLRKR